MKDFIEKCRKNSLKITPQRTAIYAELVGDRTHPSAENIYKRIRKIHPAISFDTVNRTLTAFAEIGLLKIVEGRGNSRRYDSDTENHHHLHCAKCGNVIDFESKNLDNVEIPKEISERHKIISKKIIVEVICEQCLLSNCLISHR